MATLISSRKIYLTFIFLLSINICQASEYTYQSYQKSITCKTQFSPIFPKNISEIQDAVRGAKENNIKIKAVGSKHSISDSICTTGIPVFLQYIQHFNYNSATETATVGAGMQLLDFLEKLNEFDRTVAGPPLFGGITIGGAIANGAHGSGLAGDNNTLSESIVSLTLVDGLGNIKTFTKLDPEFTSLTVNLGLFGIVYEIEFITIPQYKLKMKRYSTSEDFLWNNTDIINRALFYDHLELWWFPNNQKVIVSEGTQVSIDTPGNCHTTVVGDMSHLKSIGISKTFEFFQATKNHVAIFQIQTYVMFSYYKAVFGIKPIYVQEDNKTSCMDNPIGLSHRMKTGRCTECSWEGEGKVESHTDSEIMIPIERFSDALKDLRDIFNTRLVNFPITGIWIRFAPKAKSLMAMNQGGNGWGWVAIEWMSPIRWDLTEPRLGVAAFQAMGRYLVEEFGGRPHWGKNGLYYSKPEVIKRAHTPELVDKFMAFRNASDPNDLFMNSFGERLRGVDNVDLVELDMTKRCGLNEVCVCKFNKDCGNGNRGDYECKKFASWLLYNVCVPSALEQFGEPFARAMIAGSSYTEETIVRALMLYPVMRDWFQ